MPRPRWSAVLGVVALVATGIAACSTTWVVVPAPATGYTAMDTLRGVRNGEDEVRIVFRFDTIVGVDTVFRLDTIVAIRFDTVVVAAPVFGGGGADRPGAPVRPGDVTPAPNPGFQPAPGTRVDTVRIVVPQLRVDTVRVTQTVVRVDTVRVGVVDTVHVATIDTVRIVQTIQRVDTVRVTETVTVPGRRVLFVPPGQHPPAGQCRVWIYDLPPGQQAPSVPCAQIAEVPPGAFILFGGDAWDFDYDWIAEVEARPGTVPPEIVSVRRRGNAPNNPASGDRP